MHKQGVQAIEQEEELWPLRASAHRLKHDTRSGQVPQFIEVEGGASWYRADPLGSYEPEARSRDPEAGAHVDFMNLKRVLLEDDRRFERDLKLFANKHGLLGLFYESVSAPIMPEEELSEEELSEEETPRAKLFVAPNAGMSKGVLYPIDPATMGIKLLNEQRLRKYGRYQTYDRSVGPTVKREVGSGVALPNELSFSRKSLVPALWPLGALSGSLEPEVLSWEEAEDEYGVCVVLDKYAPFGVSVLPTREPISEWRSELENFPSGDLLTAREGFALGNINAHIANVSPYDHVGEDGTIKRGWRCLTLLTACYFMLRLDISEGRSFPRCQLSEDCGRYFRKGPQDTTVYCSGECADVARQRRRRSHS